LSEISTINKTNNTEHGEENVQMKTHAYVHRWDEWIPHFLGQQREHFPDEELTLGKNRLLEVASLVEW